MKPVKNKGKDKHRMKLAEYECTYCGSLFVTRVHNIENGHTKSCGCTRYSLQKNTLDKMHDKEDWRYPQHIRDTAAFKAWKSLGDDVPLEWLNFYSFINDIWEPPNEYWIISKKDNTLPHSEENTVWKRVSKRSNK